MSKFQDLTGQKIGKLLVIERAESKIDYRGKLITCWKCQCECGKIIIVRKCNLTSKNNPSCGCVRIDDLSNKKFGRLTAIKMLEDKTKGVKWLCKCDCGNETVVYSSFLKNGHTKSCGCLQKENAHKIFSTHHLSKTKLYKKWNSMKNRCYIKTQTMYEYYGGRGIKICDEWLDKEKGFLNFYNWAMQNGYQDNLTIDRIDVDGNYEPNNCRWITMQEQSNNKRNTRFITYHNKTHTIAEWSNILKIPYKLLYARYRRGYCPEEIFYNGDLREIKNGGKRKNEKSNE